MVLLSFTAQCVLSEDVRTRLIDNFDTCLTSNNVCLVIRDCRNRSLTNNDNDKILHDDDCTKPSYTLLGEHCHIINTAHRLTRTRTDIWARYSKSALSHTINSCLRCQQCDLHPNMHRRIFIVSRRPIHLHISRPTSIYVFRVHRTCTSCRTQVCYIQYLSGTGLTAS